MFCLLLMNFFCLFSIVKIDTKTGRIDISDPNNEEKPPRAFTFDTVYDAKFVFKFI